MGEPQANIPTIGPGGYTGPTYPGWPGHPYAAAAAAAAAAAPTIYNLQTQQALQTQQVLPTAPGASQRPPIVAAAEQALADPYMREAIKQQAIHIGGHAAVAARHYGHQGLMAFQDYVQQGPRGVSVLCFVGGVATSVIGAMNVCNVFGSVTDPFHYILNAYMFVFGLATAVVEADTDRIGMMIMPFDRLAEPVTKAQAWLHEECRLLTQLRGRGFFYLYQGTLMVTQCILCPLFLAGLYNMIMGVLCVMMSFGYTPDFDYIAASAGLYGTADTDTEDIDHSPVANAASMDTFARAQALYRSNKEHLPGRSLRELWALHNQATEGDCNVPKPTGVFNGSAKEQWRLWHGLGGIPKEEAKAMFIERLRKDNIVV